MTIAYNTESAYFLLSKTHTLCECGQNTIFRGCLGASRLLGLRGYLWRLSVVSRVITAWPPSWRAVGICRGVVVASVRLHLSGLHHRGSINTGAAAGVAVGGCRGRGVVAPSGRLLSLLLAPSVGLSVGAVGLLPVGLRRRGVRYLNIIQCK